ncbi:hypothetical protein CEXT_34511 [Caerostris extrusa]|uniref:Ycf15 n=1 Tax=Caerostris extrusa TaxID=172846 RepID=A0AAV4TXQ3_CAEEX|nr:hypothetical protein CEXT_34511 [Caerostris extrusa]
MRFQLQMPSIALRKKNFFYEEQNKEEKNPHIRMPFPFQSIGGTRGNAHFWNCSRHHLDHLQGRRWGGGKERNQNPP